jgi:hypothetical protein
MTNTSSNADQTKLRRRRGSVVASTADADANSSGYALGSPPQKEKVA